MFDSISIGVLNSLFPTLGVTTVTSGLTTLTNVSNEAYGLADSTLGTTTVVGSSALTMYPMYAAATDINETMQTTNAYIESLSDEELEDLRDYLYTLNKDENLKNELNEIASKKEETTSDKNKQSLTYRELQAIEDSFDDLTFSQLHQVKGYLEYMKQDSSTKNSKGSKTFW